MSPDPRLIPSCLFYLSIQAHVSGVDSPCLVVDAEHDLGHGVGRNTLLANDGVAQNGVFSARIIRVGGRYRYYRCACGKIGMKNKLSNQKKFSAERMTSAWSVG